ncbi:MAG: hypothetical protein RL758_2068 [Pseudomonadota bacterium]
MSELTPAQGEPGATAASTGLKQAREQAGLHLVAMAAMLKVPVQRLEALESGRYHELPDMTFARALASSVCRVLKIDPQPVLAALPEVPSSRLGEPVGSLSTPMPVSGRTPFSQPSASKGERRVSWAQALALLVVVVAVTLWFLLPERSTQPSVATVTSSVPAVVQTAQSVTATATTEKPAEPSQPSSQASSSVAPPPAAIPSPPAVPETATPATPAGSVVELRATEASWVQVTGASGRVLVQRGLQPGERVSFAADLPLAVVIGRADGVEVTVRGAALDLTPMTRNNVARFEVK